MLRGRTLAALATVGLLCDALSSEDGFTWLTVPQRDTRRSRSSGASASISADGRDVAVTSVARLSAGDLAALADIYVLDRETTTVTLESASVEGRPLNSDCSQPAISADGRYVVFDAIVGDDPARSATDVVLRDRVANTARRITIGSDGARSNGWRGQPVLGASGGVVVFASSATNLVLGPDVNASQADVYRFDRAGNAIERISVDSGGAQHQGGSLTPSVSEDGRYVAFSSAAVLGNPPGPEQVRNQARFPAIYLRDTRTGRTTPVGGTAPPDDGSVTPVISANGQFVAFVSRATNLVPRDRNKASDVFLYEVTTRAITLVSRSSNGATANGASLGPAISADGRFVAFQSDASDMACARNCPSGEDDINLLPDVFVFDRVTGQIASVSLDGHGTWLEESGAPAIAGNGAVVAFPSRHPISAGDVLNDFDLFVRVLSR
jgi:Tol biopolymer transport system component